MFENLSCRIVFNYTNYKGVYSERKVSIIDIYYGETEYHKGNQWLLKGFDLDKNELRIFSMNDMTDIKPLKEEVIMRRGEPLQLTFEDLVLKVVEYENLNQIPIYSEKEAFIYLNVRKATIKRRVEKFRQDLEPVEFYEVKIGWQTIYGEDFKFIANAFEDLSHNAPCNYEKLTWWSEQSKYKYN